MNTTLYPCKREDYEALLQFLNKAFKKEEENWFVKHMGNIYEPIDTMDDERIAYNNIIKDKGQIVASIAIFPMPMRCTMGKEVIHFNMAGIGSVAVDENYRGKGIMTAMLQQVNQKMKDKGYPISWLQGDRFRYKNYGWDTAGMQNQITVAVADLVKLNVTKAHGTEAIEKDIPRLQEIHNNYENCQIRSETLWASHLKRKGLATVIKGDSYLIYQKHQPEHLCELVGRQDILSLLWGHMVLHKLDSATINCPRDSSELTKELMAIGSSYHTTAVGCSSGRIQILDAAKMWSLIETVVTKELDTYSNVKYKTQLLQQSKDDLIKQCLDFVDSGKHDFMPKLPLWVSEIDLV